MLLAGRHTHSQPNGGYRLRGLGKDNYDLFSMRHTRSERKSMSPVNANRRIENLWIDQNLLHANSGYLYPGSWINLECSKLYTFFGSFSYLFYFFFVLCPPPPFSLFLTFGQWQDEETISIQRCVTITGSAVFCQVSFQRVTHFSDYKSRYLRFLFFFFLLCRRRLLSGLSGGIYSNR